MHPLTGSFAELSDEELQQKMSKLMSARRFARDPNMARQVEMILDDLRQEQAKRSQKYLDQLANKNKKNLSDIIDIK